MHVLLITDSDLDGIGCGIVLSKVDGIELDIVYSDARKINDDVTKIMRDGSYREYDMVYITDLSVDVNVADQIDALDWERCTGWRLFDHHATAKHMEAYAWALVKTHDDSGRLCCGTFLVYENFGKDILDTMQVGQFVSLVNSYDTYNWVSEGRVEAKHFNDLFHIYGRERFIDHINEVIDDRSASFIGRTEQMFIDIEQERIARHIKNKSKQMTKIKTTNYTVGIVYSEKYVSETGNTLCTDNPDMDFIAIIDPGFLTVGLRTVKDNIDLSAIAKQFGGGGHKKAAGFPITMPNVIHDMLTVL